MAIVEGPEVHQNEGRPGRTQGGLFCFGAEEAGGFDPTVNRASSDMVGSIPARSSRNRNMYTHHIIERYRTARERLKQAYIRGGEDEVDRFQDEVDSLWRVMPDAARRTVLGIDGEEKRAAA